MFNTVGKMISRGGDFLGRNQLRGFDEGQEAGGFVGFTGEGGA